MTVVTVTLSPAFDKTYYADNFTTGEVNRAGKVKTNMGGKGINFTAVLSGCSIPCVATGFMGEGRERFFSFLEQVGAKYDFVNTEGEIRTNIKICDEAAGVFTDLNQSSPEISAEDMEKLYEKVESLLCKGDMLYLGGTLPKGAERDTYKRFVRIGKECGCTVVLDASGDALLAALSEKPHIIKPNRDEAAEILKCSINTDEEAVAAARKLCDMGAENVLLSLGDKGAICCKDGNVLKADAIDVNVKSTVGAGDSFLAGFIYGLYNGYDIEKSLKYAASFSAAKISEEGTDIPSFEKMISYADKINCKTI